MRDAISLLDQLSSTGEKVTLTYAQNVLGTATSQAVVDLLNAVIQRKPAAGLNIIQRTLDAGSDPRQFARQVVDYCRNLMLIKMGKKDQLESSAEVRKQMGVQAESLPMDHLLEVIRLFNEAATDVRLGWQPGLQLELALAESIQWQAAEIPAGTPTPQPAPVTAPAPIRQSAPAPARPAAAKPAPAASPVVSTTSPKPESQLADRQAAEKPQPVPAAPSAEGSIGLKEVLANWKQVKEAVRKQRPVTEGLLNSCQPLTMKGDTLVLAFTNEAIKDRMEKPENLGLAQSALNHVLGKEVRITCVLNRKATGAPLDLEIEEDGMVRTALNLGGVIKKKE
jgi:DNA polymerase-3 subunit gamma/tau